MTNELAPEMWHAMPAIRQELLLKAVLGRPRAGDPPDELFHYTSPDAFVAILESNSVWLTNAAYLNDQLELTYPVGLARELVDAKARATGDVSVKLFLSAVGRTLESHQLYKQWYVGSFTTEGDLLSQWRAYCPRGGYSLGFFGGQLVSILRRSGLELRAVIYGRERQVQIIEEVVTEFLKVWIEMPGKYPDITQSDVDIEVASMLAVALGLEFVTFKSPAFSEEREWRIVRQCLSGDQLRFRERQGLLTPYMSVDLADEDGKLPLSRIDISPLIEAELANHAAALLLEQNQYQRVSELLRAPAYRLRF